MKLQDKSWVVVLFLFVSTFVSAVSKSDWDYYQASGHRGVTWDPLIEAGLTALDGGNRSAGLHFLKRALNLGCRDGLVYYRLGLVQEAEEDFNGALGFFLLADPLMKDRFPEYPPTKEIKDHVGNIYYSLGKYKEAKEAYLAAVKENGENFVRLFLIGQIERMNGEPQSAIGSFEKALQYAPPLGAEKMKTLAHIELMQLFHSAKNDEQVLKYAEAVLEGIPNYPSALKYKEEVLKKKSQSNQEKDLKEILKKY